MKKTLLCLTSLALPVQAATVIDDFFLGSTDVTQTGIGSDIDIDTGLSTSQTIGGIRIARAHNVAGTGDNRVTNTTVPGRLDWSVDTDTTGHFHLYYGYTDYTLTGEPENWNEATGNFADLEADFSADAGISVTVAQADVPDDLRIGLITNRGEANEVVVSVTVPVASSASPQTVAAAFASFTVVEGVIGDLDLSNVDQIIVEAAMDLTSADWSITQIETYETQIVPEPSTALLGLLGLMGIARRRR